MIRYCANPTTVPITKDKNAVVNNRLSKINQLYPCAWNPGTNIVRNTKIEIFGITVNHVVTIVGTPSYTSGAQLWKGAAATLNKNPTAIKTIPNTTPLSVDEGKDTLVII